MDLQALDKRIANEDVPLTVSSSSDHLVVEGEMALEARAKAWYAIQFEEIVESLVAAIRPHLRSTHTVAFVRSIVHGHLTGIVSAIFTPPIVPLFIRGVGLEIAEFCRGTPAALTDYRLALLRCVVSDMPIDLIDIVAPRFEPVLTEIIWGYAVTGAELERARDAIAPRPAASEYGLDASWYEALFDQAPAAIAIFDSSMGRLLAGNRQIEEMFGYTLGEFDAVPNEDVLGPESPDGDHDVAVELTAGLISHFRRIGAFRHKAGHMVWFDVTAWLVRDANDMPVYIAYAYTPHNTGEGVEQHWQRADRRFRYLAQLSSDPTFIVGVDGVIRYASPATERSLGIEPDLAVGTAFRDLVVEADWSRIIDFRAELEAWPRQTKRTEIRLARRDGQWRWFELTGANLLDVPDVEGFSMQARDITDRKRIESLLAEQAMMDPLTGLLNRRGILEQIELGILRSKVSKVRIAVLYVDLDNFKTVNDRFGHQSGDDVLMEIGRRLTNVLDGTSVGGRIGGDEFVVLIEEATRERVVAISAEIGTQLTKPMELGLHEHQVGASIGVAISAPGRETSESLIRAADAALYRAKASRDGVPVITEEQEIDTESNNLR
jgi:diguanylate cyclase (GGDEF)-like protein/PAS domain S-box-containing protein